MREEVIMVVLTFKFNIFSSSDTAATSPLNCSLMMMVIFLGYYIQRSNNLFSLSHSFVSPLIFISIPLATEENRKPI